MKQEEAGKKWCPFAVPGSERPFDRIYCITTSCMAWRKEKDTYGDDYGKDIPDDLGYCGLVGRI